VFFSHFMKFWYQPIGPSEVHQVGFSKGDPVHDRKLSLILRPKGTILRSTDQGLCSQESALRAADCDITAPRSAAGPQQKAARNFAVLYFLRATCPRGSNRQIDAERTAGGGETLAACRGTSNAMPAKWPA
jgi:hypothetical protein